MKKVAQAILAGWLITWLLYSFLLAGNLAFHHALHDDAGHASHQCAITLIEQQQILTSDSLPKIVKSSFAFDAKSSTAVTLILSADDVQLAPGRAPPVSFLL